MVSKRHKKKRKRNRRRKSKTSVSAGASAYLPVIVLDNTNKMTSKRIMQDYDYDYYDINYDSSNNYYRDRHHKKSTPIYQVTNHHYHNGKGYEDSPGGYDGMFQQRSGDNIDTEESSWRGWPSRMVSSILGGNNARSDYDHRSGLFLNTMPASAFEHQARF